MNLLLTRGETSEASEEEKEQDGMGPKSQRHQEEEDKIKNKQPELLWSATRSKLRRDGGLELASWRATQAPQA